MCASASGVNLRVACDGSAAAAFLELLPAPPRAWLVPPDLLPGAASRSPAHSRRQIRHLAERQSWTTEVDLSLLA